MPMYTCFSPPGAFDQSARAALAERITDVHCSLTTAPRTFVHVVFVEREPEADGAAFAVHGGIRAGRPAEVTAGLIDGMTQAVADVSGEAQTRVTMTTRETPASWIMEGGVVLPEPGDEAAWVAAHA